ncbi:SET domain-containing protein-lysine N-methyltransferase [Polluticoccus soli]|uniref:SET domain-containing protein-lysine N-methyltransferase n=1 Tax=Polluticoccus soli TaxID=3034150 RepID=UPI0023E0CA86|nr:SET domain-containing protein-lysine N-methyltransferase [Flavipsychrobacter sp. JY13-12]
MILGSIYIDQSEGRGNGVFTSEDIAADTIVELSPVIVMTEKERKLLDQTLLHDYIFEWTPKGMVMCCMAQGYISVYNHSYESNCEYFMNYDDNTIMIRSVRHIEPGEELTINYNGDWNDDKTVWFETI